MVRIKSPPPSKARPCKREAGLYHARMDANPSLCEIAQTFSQAQISKKVDHLNAELLKICERAIAQASEAPPAIRDWRDLKTAREIMAAASGTDQQKPLVNLIFPPSLDGQSSELPGYVRLSDITNAKGQGQPAPAAPDQFDDLPAVALHAIAVHERTLGTTGRGAGGQTASA